MGVILWIRVILLLQMVSECLMGAQKRLVTDTSEDICSECKYPQLERFRLDELVNTQNEGEVVSRYIVLLRCRPTGACCLYSDEICTVKTESEECIQFEFHSYSDADRLQRKSITVSNHTECACQKAAKQEKEKTYNMSDKIC